MARSFWRLIHLCLALGTGYQLSMMGTPTCCLFMCPGLAYKVEILRVTSQERDPAEHSIFFVVVQSLSHVHSLLPHGQQHTRLPCPSPSPRACSNWCPLSQWCYLTISSSAALFSSCPQSFPASLGLGNYDARGSKHPLERVFDFSWRTLSWG